MRGEAQLVWGVWEWTRDPIHPQGRGLLQAVHPRRGSPSPPRACGAGCSCGAAHARWDRRAPPRPAGRRWRALFSLGTGDHGPRTTGRARCRGRRGLGTPRFPAFGALTFSPLGPSLPGPPLVPGSPLRPCREYVCGWGPRWQGHTGTPHSALPTRMLAARCGPSRGFRKCWAGSWSAVHWARFSPRAGDWPDRLSARSPSSLQGQAGPQDATPGGSALGLGPSRWEVGHPRTGWLGWGHRVTPISPRSGCPGLCSALAGVLPGGQGGGAGRFTGTECPAGARRAFLGCSGVVEARWGHSGSECGVNSRARLSGPGAQARLWLLSHRHFLGLRCCLGNPAESGQLSQGQDQGTIRPREPTGGPAWSGGTVFASGRGPPIRWQRDRLAVAQGWGWGGACCLSCPPTCRHLECG